jgi:lipase
MRNVSPVLFVHGFIGTLDVTGYELPHAAPDLLGYGEHRGVPFDAISIPGQVEHLRAFVDARFGSEPVDVVGHSVGGAIAMLFARAYPECVRRIVNVEGNFTLGDAFWSASVGRMSQAEA